MEWAFRIIEEKVLDAIDEVGDFAPVSSYESAIKYKLKEFANE
jgi:hypothetical protein